MNPGVRLRAGHQHWQFWPILARFTDYYSMFWGPGVISTINEHWGSFMCGHQHSHFGEFWPISWIITHHFGVPKRFARLVKSEVRLRAGHQH